MEFPTLPAVLTARNLRVAELDQSPDDALFRI